MKKLLKKIRFIYRRRKLKYQDFSIISNNCWGGVVSEYFGLRKNSPTVGLFFFADDYIKFIYDLRRYTSAKLEFISIEESKYKDELIKKKCENCIIGKIIDIEIFFLHYKNQDEAKQKWERRCKRINWNNLFIKFSEMNNCSYKNIKDFDDISFDNKIVFTHIPMPDIKASNYYPGYEKEGEILFDTNPFNKSLNIYDFLNKEPCAYPLKKAVKSSEEIK